MKHHLRIASMLTSLLENHFSIFGRRFGLDPLIGLFAGAGDLVTLVVGVYFLWIATKIGVPSRQMVIMGTNILLDVLIGIIPVLGDIFDFTFKAHTKNMQILEDHTNRSERPVPLKMHPA